MPHDPDNPADWIALAVEDLRAARALLFITDPPVIDPGLYHIQQALEKALKGVLVARELEPPRTHDIGMLLTLCRPDDEIMVIKEDLESTTLFAVQMRYPGPRPPQDIDSNHFINVCQIAIDWALRQVAP